MRLVVVALCVRVRVDAGAQVQEHGERSVRHAQAEQLGAKSCAEYLFGIPGQDAVRGALGTADKPGPWAGLFTKYGKQFGDAGLAQAVREGLAKLCDGEQRYRAKHMAKKDCERWRDPRLEDAVIRRLARGIPRGQSVGDYDAYYLESSCSAQALRYPVDAAQKRYDAGPDGVHTTAHQAKELRDLRQAAKNMIDREPHIAEGQTYMANHIVAANFNDVAFGGSTPICFARGDAVLVKHRLWDEDDGAVWMQVARLETNEAGHVVESLESCSVRVFAEGKNTHQLLSPATYKFAQGTVDAPCGALWAYRQRLVAMCNAT